MTQRGFQNLLRVLPWAAGLVFIVLIRTALLSKGFDFEIFWKTGKRIAGLHPIYLPEIDGGRSFKYPPWAAPFFAPLALFSEQTGGILWRLMLVTCLGWTTIHLVSGRAPGARGAVLATFVAMLGIWNANIQAAQITTALVAAALIPWTSRATVSNWRATAMVIGLSTKIFPLMAVAALGKALLRPSLWAGLLLAAGVLSLPAWVSTPEHSWIQLFRDFAGSASNTGAVLGGSMNGLPALLSIGLGIERDQMGHQSVLAAVSTLLVFGSWLMVRHRLSSAREKAMLALALSTAVTPLAYTYGLGLAYPWFALRMASAAENRFRSRHDWASLAALAWIILPLPFRALAPVATLAALPRKQSA